MSVQSRRAYSLKTDSTQALKGKPLDGAWFGYEPRPIPFEKVVKTDDDFWLGSIDLGTATS